MVNAFASPDTFQTNLTFAPNAVKLVEPSWSADLVQFAQETWVTMDKNVSANQDTPKLESSALKPVRLTSSLTTTDFATHAQSTKSSQTESAPVSLLILETAPLESANLHAQLLNSSTKEDVPSAHWTSNTEQKSKDAPVLMDSTLTTTESAKRSQSPKSPAMPDSSSTAQRDVLPAHQDASHVQAPTFVPPVPQLDSALSAEPVKPPVVMESLLELNNAMTETTSPTTAVPPLAQLKLSGLALVNHQSAHTTVHQFAEMDVLRMASNAMTETWSMETAAATDVKKKPQLPPTPQPQQPRAWSWSAMLTLILTTYLLFWKLTRLSLSLTKMKCKASSRPNSPIQPQFPQSTALKEKPPSWTLSTALPSTAAESPTKNTESNFHIVIKETLDSSQSS